MATQEISAQNVQRMGPAPANGLRYVARQPILDAQSRVHGYELLFRSGPEAVFRGDSELASRTMIDNTVLYGLETLTGGRTAFVNCTADILTGQQVCVLPPRMTVLEILETVEPFPKLISACRKLKTLGFRLALDDFVWTPSIEPLVALADYIKIDVLATGRAERMEVLSRLNRYSVALVAEKVETRDVYNQVCSEGFTLFQGYYFCHPTLLTNRKVPSNKILHMEMLGMLQQVPLDLRKLSELVKRDASLMCRLLRIVNSPICAIRQEVRSIQVALMAVGDEVFRRIATLAIGCELNAGQPAETVRMAFVRARFCELASALCALNPTEQYLLGIFSMLPSMLETPMNEVISALPLRDSICEALLGASNSERCLLQWLEANENGDWPQCDAVARSYGMEQSDLHQCFAEAVLWGELILSAT